MRHVNGTVRVSLVVAAFLGAGLAAAEPPAELGRLRAENAQLRARLEALEAENQELKRLAGVVPPETVEQAAAARLTTEFDAAAGVTTVATRPSPLDVTQGSRAEHSITLRHEQGGPEPTAGVMLLVATTFSGGIYRRVKTMHLRVDGREEECEVVGFRARPIMTGPPQRRIRRDHEWVTVAIGPPTLGRIASARNVSGALGRTRFVLTPEQLMSFRALQRRIEAVAGAER